MVRNNELEKLLKKTNPIKVEKKVIAEKNPKDLFSFDKEDMRKGIVLSEILGPPKGRK